LESFLTRVRSAITGRPVTATLAALGIGLLVASGVAAALAVPQINDLTDERDAAEAEAAAALTAQSEAEGIAERITGRRDTIIGDAQNRADEILGDANEQLDDLNSEISEATETLGSTQSELSDVQASLDQAEEVEAKSSFGNGTWQSGVDYIPGTYEAPGGGGCYWEKLKGPSGGGINNIIDNGGFNKNQIVSVDSPYFHTEGCGTWTRVGG
jgi:hypothetical protein